jgi:hypothetical protein
MLVSLCKQYMSFTFCKLLQTLLSCHGMEFHFHYPLPTATNKFWGCMHSLCFIICFQILNTSIIFLRVTWNTTIVHYLNKYTYFLTHISYNLNCPTELHLLVNIIFGWYNCQYIFCLVPQVANYLYLSLV